MVLKRKKIGLLQKNKMNEETHVDWTIFAIESFSFPSFFFVFLFGYPHRSLLNFTMDKLSWYWWLWRKEVLISENQYLKIQIPI